VKVVDAVAGKSKPSELAQRARALYESRLKAILEPEQNGRAVAIHVDSGDYVVADTHTAAGKVMDNLHPDGFFVTMTIGPVTAADFAVAQRILAGQRS
jgi:hypothetical protein